MVLTTFQNPACSPLPASQIYNPPSRETTLCLDISAKHKNLQEINDGHIYQILIQLKNKHMQYKAI